MDSIRIKLKDIRFNSADGCFEAVALLTGRTCVTLRCAYPADRDADLRDVIGGLTRMAIRSYRQARSAPRPIGPIPQERRSPAQDPLLH